MIKYMLTEEQAHAITDRAADGNAVGWCDTHGAIRAAAIKGEEICATYEKGRFDIVAGKSFCILHKDAALGWLALNGFDPTRD